jgi:hypothetical protein
MIPRLRITNPNIHFWLEPTGIVKTLRIDADEASLMLRVEGRELIVSHIAEKKPRLFAPPASLAVR